ncbi:unnamed protein product, partial [Caenorhabditis brenneri]
YNLKNMFYQILTLFTIAIFVSADLPVTNKKTICPSDGDAGPTTGGMCSLGSKTVLNGMCCKENKIQYVACEDQLDAQGKSLCPITKAGCYRNLLGSLKNEIDLCAKTCLYCPMPPMP